MQGLIELKQGLGLSLRSNQLVLERNALPVPAPLQRQPRLGSIGENVPHRQRRKGEEVGPIFPAGAGLVDQLQVRFVDQCGGGEAATVLTGEMTMGDETQLVVEQRDKSIERVPPPAPEFSQQIGPARSCSHKLAPERLATRGGVCRFSEDLVVFPGEGEARPTPPPKPYPGGSMLVKELTMGAWLGGLLAMATACDVSGPNEHASPAAQLDATKFWESGASVYWNGVARNLVFTLGSNPFQAIRGFSVLSAAQYNAAVAAEESSAPGQHPSVRAAVGKASVVVLSYLYPLQAAALNVQLTDFLASPAWPGQQNDDQSSGVAIGLSVGQALVARATTDGFFAPWSGNIPTGPGIWFSSASPPAPPVGPQFGKAKTYFLLSGDQFRPPPPPAFGSAEFLAGLAEVRHYSDTRTQEQVDLARFWDRPPGLGTPPSYWNKTAADLAVQYHLDERKAAHLFALMNMTGFDAIVASHDAKYFYWLLRPTQADPGITLAVPLPNFPSYPSNHAALSAAMAAILGREFPAEQERLAGLADQAALSRVYGGIHYWFDGEAGLVLGRKVADWAISHDVNGHEPFVLR